jgi:hypothetical protein
LYLVLLYILNDFILNASLSLKSYDYVYFTRYKSKDAIFIYVMLPSSFI